VHLVLSPLSWVIVLAILLQAGPVRSRRRLRNTLCVALLASLVLMTPMGANALVGLLEGRALQAQIARCDALPARANAAGSTVMTGILLAGGFDRSPHDSNDIGALTQASQARALHAAELHHRGLLQRLVISGGSDHPVAEASVIATLLVQLGVPASALEIETRSRTTWQNAQEVAALLRPAGAGPAAGPTGVPPPPVLLLTSAIHTPRALLAFDSVGLHACPAPAQWAYVPPQWHPGYVLPQSSALDKAEDALHELVGLLNYGLRDGLQSRR
jgi:uncharacterized SAM-binding protein YcdF (DUF218 family)